MEKTRQPIPVGLAEMPPGPGLAVVLAGIDLGRLGGLDCVTVMRAQHRQAAHEQARLMAAMVEVACCGVGPDDQLPRMDAPDEFSADEIRGALVWTRAAANTQLSLAWDLLSRLPQVFATLDHGAVDVPKAKVFSEWTGGLTDEQARQVCDALLPEAPGLTTGQLCERIKKMAIAIDPDWARRRYEEAVRDRKVVGYRNEDGSANLCGYQLPADRAAAACAHLDALAKKIKHAGDRRPIDHVRADLYLAMLDGSYTGWSEQDIISHVLATAGDVTAGHDDRAEQSQGERVVRRRPDPHQRDGQVPPRDSGGVDTESPDLSPDPPRDDDTGTSDQTPDQTPDQPLADDPRSAGTVLEGVVVPPPAPTSPSAPTSPPPPPSRRAGVEVRAEITTLLGWDEHPGELPGSGPIHADLARRLVREQTAAEWRYAITDDDGRLLYEGITRRRPDGYPSRAASPCRGGIVELHIKITDLRQLAARPVRLGGWANVIADLARQADQHEQTDRLQDIGQRGQPDRHAGDGRDSRPNKCEDRREGSGRDGQPDRRGDRRADNDRHEPGLGRHHHRAGRRPEGSDGGTPRPERPGMGDERGPRSPGRPLRRHTEVPRRSTLF